jgi:GNAT superfamily N-acetyltransferase
MGGGAVLGNIVNVYTQAQFRRRGLARSLVPVTVDWCRENGTDCVMLHASAEGGALRVDEFSKHQRNASAAVMRSPRHTDFSLVLKFRSTISPGVLLAL